MIWRNDWQARVGIAAVAGSAKEIQLLEIGEMFIRSTKGMDLLEGHVSAIVDPTGRLPSYSTHKWDTDFLRVLAVPVVEQAVYFAYSTSFGHAVQLIAATTENGEVRIAGLEPGDRPIENAHG